MKKFVSKHEDATSPKRFSGSQRNLSRTLTDVKVKAKINRKTSASCHKKLNSTKLRSDSRLSRDFHPENNPDFPDCGNKKCNDECLEKCLHPHTKDNVNGRFPTAYFWGFKGEVIFFVVLILVYSTIMLAFRLHPPTSEELSDEEKQHQLQTSRVVSHVLGLFVVCVFLIALNLTLRFLNSYEEPASVIISYFASKFYRKSVRKFFVLTGQIGDSFTMACKLMRRRCSFTSMASLPEGQTLDSEQLYLTKEKDILLQRRNSKIVRFWI